MKEINKYILRPIKAKDAKSIYRLSKQAQAGLSNLPTTKSEINALIKKSINSFEKKQNRKKKKFIFVIEDNDEIVGISGIKARVGVTRPYYSFNINRNEQYPFLELIEQHLGPSEIGSLFLSPNHRKQGLGRLLSLSRFLFIKCFKDEFTNIIIAELRGYLDQDNNSPFWNNLGQKFIPTSFTSADKKSILDKTFIQKHFPKKPIYINLLKSNIEHYMKKVHPNTEAAKKLLLNENFRITNHIDIFDGGPKLECITSEIRTIKESQKKYLKDVEQPLNKSKLICNTKFQDFRCIRVSKNTTIEDIKKRLNIKSDEDVVEIEEKN